MGISKTQYHDIMFKFDQKRMENRRKLDDRYRELYIKYPRLKEIHDEIITLSVEQARLAIICHEKHIDNKKKYEDKREQLLKEKMQILTENGYPSDYLSPIYSCKKCKDTGYVDNSPCTCLKQAKIKALYENSNLSGILQKHNFDNFNCDMYDNETVWDNLSLTPRENIIVLKEEAENFVKYFDNEYENIIYYGPTGVGKTFITHCIAKELLDTSHTVVYLTSLQLFDILEKNKFSKDDISTSNEKISYMLDCDLLIIDDLGTEMSNSFTVSELYYFIEERHINKRSTIISSNLSFKDIRERYSERILSRLTGYYKFRQIIGKDFRIESRIR